MTKRPDKVEPPLARRHVQLTIATLSSLLVLSLGIQFWFTSSSSQQERATTGGRTAGGEDTALIRIDLNSAAARELLLLPRVGPVLADRIIDHRRRTGSFGSVDDLRQVHGIGPKTLDEIRRLCVVGPVPNARNDSQIASSSRIGEESPGHLDP